MTLRFGCSGRCQDRVGRTGEWKKVVDVDSPRLIAVLLVCLYVFVCVGQRRWAGSECVDLILCMRVEGLLN